MKSFLTTLRTSLLAIGAAGMLMPSAVWAKGPSGGGGSSFPFTHRPSGTSSSSAASSATNKSNNSAKNNSSGSGKPAKNGNTGYTGMGMPKQHRPADLGKIFGHLPTMSDDSDSGMPVSSMANQPMPVTASVPSQNVMDIISDLGDDLGDAANDAGQVVSDVTTGIVGAATDAGNDVSDATDAVINAVGEIANSASQFPGPTGVLAAGIASGGVVAAVILAEGIGTTIGLAAKDGNPNKQDPSQLTNGSGSQNKSGTQTNPATGGSSSPSTSGSEKSITPTLERAE